MISSVINIGQIGHCIVYGQTFSGKTHFTKHLIKQLNPNNVYVFTTSPHDWVGYETYDNFENNIKNILINSKAAKDTNSHDCKNIVVFDDFNSEINTSQNKAYNELFTSGRHYGIRVINLAQQSKHIGPTVRSNARYIFIMAVVLEDELKKLADMFFNKEKFALKKITTVALKESQYACVMIDANNRQTSVYIAPAIKKSNIPKEEIEIKENDNVSVIPRINEYNKTIDVVPPQGSALRETPSDAIFQGTQSYDQMRSLQTSFGNKYAQNMVDNSQNNFQIDYRIKNQQLIETNQIANQNRIEINNINNQISYQNYLHEKKLNFMREVDEVKRLLDQPHHTLTRDNKILIARVFNTTLQPKKKQFTEFDYKLGTPYFMERFCKRKVEVKNNNILDVLENTVDIYNSSNPIEQLSGAVSLYKNWFG